MNAKLHKFRWTTKPPSCSKEALLEEQATGSTSMGNGMNKSLTALASKTKVWPRTLGNRGHAATAGTTPIVTAWLSLSVNRLVISYFNHAIQEQSVAQFIKVWLGCLDLHLPRSHHWTGSRERVSTCRGSRTPTTLAGGKPLLHCISLIGTLQRIRSNGVSQGSKQQFRFNPSMWLALRRQRRCATSFQINLSNYFRLALTYELWNIQGLATFSPEAWPKVQALLPILDAHIGNPPMSPSPNSSSPARDLSAPFEVSIALRKGRTPWDSETLAPSCVGPLPMFLPELHSARPCSWHDKVFQLEPDSSLDVLCTRHLHCSRYPPPCLSLPQKEKADILMAMKLERKAKPTDSMLPHLLLHQSWPYSHHESLHECLLALRQAKKRI